MHNDHGRYSFLFIFFVLLILYRYLPTRIVGLRVSIISFRHESFSAKIYSPKLENTCSKFSTTLEPAGIYLLKVSNTNTRTRCEICSKFVFFVQSKFCFVCLCFRFLEHKYSFNIKTCNIYRVK